MPQQNGIQWDLDNLLQELMLALVGYTGDIFVDNSNHDPRYLHSCTWHVLLLVMNRRLSGTTSCSISCSWHQPQAYKLQPAPNLHTVDNALQLHRD
jgi:hypothetical protein